MLDGEGFFYEPTQQQKMTQLEGALRPHSLQQPTTQEPGHLPAQYEEMQRAWDQHVQHQRAQLGRSGTLLPTQRNSPTPSVISALDTNGDGMIDTIAYDTTGDGMVDKIEYDTNHDGKVDRIEFDTSRDGKVDTIHTDTNHDGNFDKKEYDTNHDGMIDTIMSDTNHDGKIDTVEWDTNHDGEINQFERLGCQA